MSVVDDIAYLRSISQATMMTVSVHRLRQIADRLDGALNLLHELTDIEGPQPGHIVWYRKVQEWLQS